MENLFKLANCEGLGDYLISKRDFEEGEVVFREEQLMTFPVESNKGAESEFCCVGCCTVVPQNSMTCSECHFPVCSSSCSQEMIHRQMECKLFERRGILPTRASYRFLKFVRLLLSKSVAPECYQKFLRLSSEFSVNEEQTKSAGHAECISALKFLTEECGLQVNISEVKKIWRALKINSFVIPSEDQVGKPCRGSALFANASKLSHSCSSNLEWSLQKKQAEDGSVKWSFHTFSTRAIKKGDILSITYIPRCMDSGTAYRREIKPLFFECLCSRCVDPTEDGTFFSSPKCRKCKKGYLLPDDPMSSFNCLWHCSTCNAEKEGSDIQKNIEKLKNLMSGFMSGEITESSLDSLDCFIEVNSGVYLHPNHFLLFQASYQWLTESTFKKKLMSRSELNTELFQNVVARSMRCLPLAIKFLHTIHTIDLELIVMGAVAAFAFKSADGGHIDASHLDRRMKVRFAKMLLKHLNRARFWVARHPTYQFMETHKETLDELHSLWTCRYDSFLVGLLNFELENEDAALLQLRSLFN